METTDKFDKIVIETSYTAILQYSVLIDTRDAVNYSDLSICIDAGVKSRFRLIWNLRLSRGYPQLSGHSAPLTKVLGSAYRGVAE